MKRDYDWMDQNTDLLSTPRSAMYGRRRDNIPYEYRPLSAWAYFGYKILFSIPLIGFILLIVFACNGENINRRSFARSYFCGLLIVLILVGITVALIMVTGASANIIEFFKGLFQRAGGEG